MISIHIDKVKNVQETFKAEITDQRKSAYNKLLLIDPTIFSIAEQTYLQSVIHLFNDASFLLKTPSEIESIKNNIGGLPPISIYTNGRPEKKQLTHYIQEALGYTQLRKTFYPKYFRNIGIKTCVYCNSQLTIVISKSKTEIDARLEVDHHYSKSDFPFFSISLFNLFPCCSSCNKRKSSTPVNFKLYTEDASKLKKSDYDFKITKTSKCNFLLTKDTEKIEIIFNDLSVLPIGNKSLQSAFNVIEIHNTQKDIIAELIIKSQVYNESFKRILQNNFSKLSLSQSDFDRVIVGNYTEEKDIHKRPFSKMTMDIAKQLGLTKQKK
ncbi:MAG: hypothetical protein CVU10_03470 [Bacteroidetes bacterium HGW-Bacteroidetes-5]|jgi:5-methylcytosine-specific restriction endonuclease McrA|nr:MAG: hypothetical protein CVU10_03470 [Bacteroidetes bacterium HGW-Bacteroidetes-5]